MTSFEAMTGIQRIQAKFGKKFMLLDLMNAWPQLLTYRADCMERAVGRIVNSSKHMPKTEYVLKVLAQLDASPVVPSLRLDQEIEARAVFKLMRGEVLREKKPAALYWLADRTQKPHYAVEAWELQQKILAESRPETTGQNLETSPVN